MKKIVLGLALLIGLTGFTLANITSKVVRGSVFNQSGSPVAGAVVTELNTFGNYTTTTDDYGNFTLKLPQRSATLGVSYLDQSASVVVPGKGNQTVHIVLSESGE